ncbi:MAG: PilZ domain-containing protein [Candidatus Aminicenantes bacterium]|nr:PilZ domain-containing protein [Candidatus Aminicenantes bacterium]
MPKKTTPKKKATAKNIDETLAELIRNRRKEWRFELPLPAMVEGKLPVGQTFHEKTTLKNISSGGAYFTLDSGVTVGSKLNLIIDLPPNLTEGKKVSLRLGGLTVRLRKDQGPGKKQGIALCFDEDFQFLADSDAKEPKKKK